MSDTAMMTKQKIFTKVAKHLLKQNAKSRKTNDGIPSGYCAYRGYNGMTCAIGCIIPDEAYELRFEGEGVRGLPETLFKAMKVSYDYNSLIFLRELQHIHDLAPVSNWPEKLKMFAKNNDLKMPRMS